MWQFNCRAGPTPQVCVSVSEKEEEDAAPPVWRLHFAAGKTPLSYTQHTKGKENHSAKTVPYFQGFGNALLAEENEKGEKIYF